MFIHWVTAIIRRRLHGVTVVTVSTIYCVTVETAVNIYCVTAKAVGTFYCVTVKAAINIYCVTVKSVGSIHCVTVEAVGTIYGVAVTSCCVAKYLIVSVQRCGSREGFRTIIGQFLSWLYAQCMRVLSASSLRVRWGREALVGKTASLPRT